jgi:hypothetical protein
MSAEELKFELEPAELAVAADNGGFGRGFRFRGSTSASGGLASLARTYSKWRLARHQFARDLVGRSEGVGEFLVESALRLPIDPDHHEWSSLHQ